MVIYPILLAIPFAIGLLLQVVADVILIRNRKIDGLHKKLSFASAGVVAGFISLGRIVGSELILLILAIACGLTVLLFGVISLSRARSLRRT